MREKVLYAIAALLAAAGAFVTALPVPGWIRKRRRRRELYGAFLGAAAQGHLRAKHRRVKEPFGGGFIDAFVGTAGLIRFRLTRRFRPFETIDAYALELADERYDFALATSKEAGHPIVAAYLDLRERCPMGERKSEAS